MSVIDPQTWADAEDGRALRELREALPSGGWMRVHFDSDGEVRIVVSRITADTYRREDVEMSWPMTPSVAEACDNARVRLVKR